MKNAPVINNIIQIGNLQLELLILPTDRTKIVEILETVTSVRLPRHMIEGWANDYSGPKPRLLGEVHWTYRLLLLSLANGPAEMMDTMKHEIAHAMAHQLGLSSRDEAVCNLLAILVEDRNRVVESFDFLNHFGGLSDASPQRSWSIAD
jgi:hypothetical protein